MNLGVRSLAIKRISSATPYSAFLILPELLHAKSAISLALILPVLVFLRVLAFEKFFTSKGLMINVSFFRLER